MSGAGQARELAGNQALAVEPADSVWLSASAGTGKTQVLSSRVLRLLLQEDVDPSQILCLTFTKAGATEMAARINETLAGWVRMKDAELAGHLKAIGADIGPGTLGRARTLFAAVLDCPGGGLRIDTIHAFAQWLLGAFPHEAGLLPGTRAMEDRDRALLARQVLADLLLDAEARGDARSLDTLTDLAVRFARTDQGDMPRPAYMTLSALSQIAHSVVLIATTRAFPLAVDQPQVGVEAPDHLDHRTGTGWRNQSSSSAP